LFRLRWPKGFRCPRCQHGEAYFQRTRNLYHCRACGPMGPGAHVQDSALLLNIVDVIQDYSPIFRMEK
jgi:uncharacterized protein (DUF983 family)